MFTGIVTEVGKILAIEPAGDLRVRIGASQTRRDLDTGASVSCDGICLTVVDSCPSGSEWFEVQISAETVSKTNAGDWSVGRPVNLERSLKVGDELGGHIVSGHIDGVASISRLTPVGESLGAVLQFPAGLREYIAPKGSIALNGVSLTVNEVTDVGFSVNLIPHTLSVTSWASAKIGDRINFEIDTVARYVGEILKTQLSP